MNHPCMKLVFSQDYSPHPLSNHLNQTLWQPIHHSMTQPWTAKITSIPTIDLQYLAIGVGQNNFCSLKASCMVSIETTKQFSTPTNNIIEQVMNLYTFRYQSSHVQFHENPHMLIELPNMNPSAISCQVNNKRKEILAIWRKDFE